MTQVESGAGTRSMLQSAALRCCPHAHGKAPPHTDLRGGNNTKFKILLGRYSLSVWMKVSASLDES